MQLRAFNSPLERVEGPLVPPKQGEVLVEIAAAGVNFADTLLVSGSYQRIPPLPFAPGMEFAGKVLAGDLPAGSRVAGFCGHGAFASHITLPAAQCVALPNDMPDDIAASFLIAYGAVHLALARRARLGPGETLVVLGASGGAGLAAVDIGRALGARVIAVSRGAARLARLTRADHVIDSDGQDLRGAILALGGANVVFDPAGGENFTQALRATRPEGRLVCFGFASGHVPEVKLNHLLVKNLDIIGVNWNSYPDFAPDAMAAGLQGLMALHASGRLHPATPLALPMADAEQALDLLRNRQAPARIVLRP
ncbi:NADPH:quinone oxidoreductase family protein [Abyssibius alkaniclasticus]|uniref:NADPH:quinone oxidoreductase family protein n=1 Tax=Abyssibius alkaniclasticus TaxID=2881234 RepID=UPI004057EEB0